MTIHNIASTAVNTDLTPLIPGILRLGCVIGIVVFVGLVIWTIGCAFHPEWH